MDKVSRSWIKGVIQRYVLALGYDAWNFAIFEYVNIELFVEIEGIQPIVDIQGMDIRVNKLHEYS